MTPIICSRHSRRFHTIYYYTGGGISQDFDKSSKTKRRREEGIVKGLHDVCIAKMCGWIFSSPMSSIQTNHKKIPSWHGHISIYKLFSRLTAFFKHLKHI